MNSFLVRVTKELPQGLQRQSRLLLMALFALPAAVVFGAAPASAIQTCTDGAMVIVAHQDDDTLFANPDIIDEVDSGGCVTAVYITAGNANRGIEYWDLREVGAQAAYANMAGVASNWTEEELTLANGAQVVSRSLVGKPQISLVFMRLPDNGPDETQLEDLWDNTRTSLSSLDGRATHTRAGLIETLTELMTLRQPDLILTHEFDANFGNGDHSDHYAAGFFVDAAHDNYQRLHTIYGYEGYGIVDRPANVSGTELSDAHSAFFAYAAWDNRVCNDAVACAASDPQVLTWLARQYIVSTDTGGTAQLGVLDVSTTAVNFGRVEIGNTETRSIVVQNTGNGELTGVTLPALSAPLRWVNPGALGSTLAVGASVTLEIEYDTASTAPAAFSGFIRTDQGSSPLTITGVAGRSGYALTDQISRIYTAAFLRAPQADGLAYWVGQRAGGRSLASIAQAFTTSPEFMARYGTLTDAEFVARVYENVLNRDPDNQGEAYWLGELAGAKSRGDMLVGFSESPEFVTETGTTPPPQPGDGPIMRLYQAYFDRAPEQPALDYWVSSGRSLTSISDFFAQSPEFAAKYGDLDDAAFISLVYRNVLGRSSDQAGETYWLGRLAQGTTRGAIMTGFSESPEYVTATETLPR